MIAGIIYEDNFVLTSAFLLLIDIQSYINIYFVTDAVQFP